jgi:hypothetical protein
VTAGDIDLPARLQVGPTSTLEPKTEAFTSGLPMTPGRSSQDFTAIRRMRPLLLLGTLISSEDAVRCAATRS